LLTASTMAMSMPSACSAAKRSPIAAAEAATAR
jgi:hypothetical protein